jgi:hypothetical protein
MSDGCALHEWCRNRVRTMTSIRFLLYMYVCDACRGAAVAITNPGLVGVWKWASLSFSFIISVILIGNMVLILVLCYMMGTYNHMAFLHNINGHLFMSKVLIALLWIFRCLSIVLNARPEFLFNFLWLILLSFII